MARKESFRAIFFAQEKRKFLVGWAALAFSAPITVGDGWPSRFASPISFAPAFEIFRFRKGTICHPGVCREPDTAKGVISMI